MNTSLLTAKEAARELGITYDGLMKAAFSGNLTSYKVGYRRLFHPDDIENYKRNRRRHEPTM